MLNWLSCKILNVLWLLSFAHESEFAGCGWSPERMYMTKTSLWFMRNWQSHMGQAQEGWQGMGLGMSDRCVPPSFLLQNIWSLRALISGDLLPRTVSPPTLCSVRWTPEVLGCLVGASITSPDLSCSVCVSPFFPPSLPLVRVAGTKLQAVTAKATPFAFCPWDWICLKKQRNYRKVCVLIRVSTATTKHHD